MTNTPETNETTEKKPIDPLIIFKSSLGLLLITSAAYSIGLWLRYYPNLPTEPGSVFWENSDLTMSLYPELNTTTIILNNPDAYIGNIEDICHTLPVRPDNCNESLSPLGNSGLLGATNATVKLPYHDDLITLGGLGGEEVTTTELSEALQHAKIDDRYSEKDFFEDLKKAGIISGLVVGLIGSTWAAHIIRRKLRENSSTENKSSAPLRRRPIAPVTETATANTELLQPPSLADMITAAGNRFHLSKSAITTLIAYGSPSEHAKFLQYATQERESTLARLQLEVLSIVEEIAHEHMIELKEPILTTKLNQSIKNPSLRSTPVGPQQAKKIKSNDYKF